MILSVTKKKNN